MSDIPVDSYDSGINPMRPLCDGSGRSEQRLGVFVQQRAGSVVKSADIAARESVVTWARSTVR